jgi:hypothetical protein
LSDLQSAATPNAQTANSDPTGAASKTGQHHHHHHEGGGEASGATSVANSATPSGTTAAPTRSATSADQAVSQVFAADIAQALQAYSGVSTSPMMPALTV